MRLAVYDPAMALHAFRDGVRRAAAAPRLLFGVYALAAAAAWARGYAGHAHPGRWTEPAPVLSGDGPGLAAAGLTNLLASLDLAGGGPAGTAPAGLAAAWLAVWTFLAGGALDRLARQRRGGRAAFLAACRHHFWPLARLAALAAAAYWFLYGALGPWFFGDVSGAPGRGPGGGTFTAAWTARHWLLGACGAAAGLLVDYARVRTVVEDRRSMLGALRAAARFVRRRPAAVALLWLLNTALAGLLLSGCGLMTRAAGAGGPPPWAPFAAGQICMAGRLFTVLVAWASQIAYFQHELAHPTYVARARLPRTRGRR